MVHFPFVHQWYGGKIPPYSSPAFPVFLESTGRFASYVLKNAPMRRQSRVTVSFSAKCAMAYSDIERCQIVLPQWVLLPETWGKVLKNNVSQQPEIYNEAVTGVLTGLLIHEAGHFRWSPTHPEDMFEGIRDHDLFKLIAGHNPFLLMMAQLVEDLYIEHQLRQETFGGFIDTVDDTLFCDERAEEMWAEFINTPTSETLGAALLTYKRPALRLLSVWDTHLPAEFRQLVGQAFDAHKPSERGAIAYDLYKLFASETDENGEPQYDLSNTAPQLPSDSPTQWGRALVEFTPDGERFEKDDEVGIMRAQRESLASLVENQETLEEALCDNIKRQALPDPTEYCSDAPAPVFRDIETVLAVRSVQPAPEAAAFGRVLKLMRHKNHAPGCPTDRGTRIVNTRLSRVATDMKIFAPPQPHDNRQPPEVIISINLSGSMRNILNRVLSVVYGMALSLRDNQIVYKVYGHTTLPQYDSNSSGPSGLRTPIVYEILDSSKTHVANRMAAATGVEMRESFDGQVMRELAKRFSTRQVRKLYIEVTDGEPNAGNYTGKEAMNHVSRVVAHLRKQDIVVVALSVDEDVIGPNNEIYGKRYNIDATQNFEAALKQVLRDFLV